MMPHPLYQQDIKLKVEMFTLKVDDKRQS